MSSELLWIAVPAGRSPSGERVLSVLVVPRLDGAKSLADEGLSAWPPAQFERADLSVEFRADPDVPAADPIVVRPRLDVQPGLWDEFFRSVHVEGPRPDVRRELKVESTSTQAATVNAIYRDAARSFAHGRGGEEFERVVRARLSEMRDAAPSKPPARVAAQRPPSPRTDFHHVTSLLREHPAIMRALGLVFDLVLPATTAVPSHGVVRVLWEGRPTPLTQMVSRWTAYDDERFRPAVRAGSDLHPAGGMVALGRRDHLGRREWELTTVDADHALSRLRDAANAETDPFVAAPALPALRTVGVALVRAGREAEILAQLRESSRRNDPAPAKRALTLDDLVLGYRIDAKVFGQPWHSLCRRVARYTVNDKPITANPREEGHVKVGAGIDHGDSVLHMDEVVTRWDGWSLAAPRPALDGRDARPSARAGLPFHLEIDLAPEPKTLLKLRFGQTYQFRARVVDVVGGGDHWSDESRDDCDSAPIHFGRREPVLPPDVRLPSGVEPADLGSGVSPYKLVIRTAEGIADAVGDTVRDLAPPQAAFEVIERHGRFDGDPERTRLLLERPELADPAAAGVVAYVRREAGGPPEDLESAFWHGAGGTSGSSSPWPDFAHKRLRLTARRGAEPTLTHAETEDEFVVRLSAAEQVTVEISSLLDDDSARQLAISEWLGDGAESTRGLNTLLTTGRHPMATPPRVLTLIHAVRRPLAKPGGPMTASRSEGDTFADLVPKVQPLGVHVASTAALDVAASWAPVSDAADPAVTDRPVGQISIARGDEELAPLRHEFGDTKHRRVTYSLTALSRFRGLFPETDDDAGFRWAGTTGPVNVPSSARPPSPVVISVVPAFAWKESSPGPGTTVRSRLGNRVRVELSGPWYATGDGETLAVLAPDDPTARTQVPFVTQAARDPIWDTAPAEPFPVAVGPRTTVTLAENSQDVAVVSHGVWSVGDRWYADVVFPASAAYGPLARLAVARYQPDSLPGLHLSPVVLTDFVPLLPDRTLTVTVRSVLHADVVLDGLGPKGPALNRVDVILEVGTSRTFENDLLVLTTTGAQAQTLADDDASLAWYSVSPVSGALGEVLALELTRGFAPLRVRVREVEIVGKDLHVQLGGAAELVERVVFTDVVRIR